MGEALQAAAGHIDAVPGPSPLVHAKPNLCRNETQQEMKMKDLFLKLWNDEEGAEIAEWVVVVALLVIVAILIYSNILSGQLSQLVTNIGAKINALT